MVDSSGADDAIFSKGYKNTFAVLSPATSYVAVIVKAIAENASPKPKTVAIISADDGFSKTAAKGGASEAEKQGMKVVTTEFVAEHTTDVSSALTKIRPKNPDLILVSAHVEEGIAAVKQSKELGLNPKGFGETVAPPTPDFVKALGEQAEGVVGSTQWTPDAKGKDKVFGTAQHYAQDFEQRFGETAEYHSAEAAAACLALVLGVEKAGSTDPAKVRDAIAGLDTDSFFGPIKFDSTGKNGEKPMSAIQIHEGQAGDDLPRRPGPGEAAVARRRVSPAGDDAVPPGDRQRPAAGRPARPRRGRLLARLGRDEHRQPRARRVRADRRLHRLEAQRQRGYRSVPGHGGGGRRAVRRRLPDPALR